MLQRNEAIPSTELDGEQVFMDLESGRYYSLKGTGLAVWQLLAEPLAEEALFQQLASTYAIPLDRCRQDTAPFLTQMLDKGLLLRKSC